MVLKIKRFLTFPLMALVIVSLVLVSGCGNTSNNTSPGTGELSGKITEAGSTSVLPLAEQFALAFMKKHPKVTITYTGGGSGAGAKQATDGTVDIGATSRGIKMKEADLISYPVARDGVAIIVNSANPVNDLSMEQAAKIFEGEISDWSAVGGNAGSITVYNREEGSGTRDTFESFVTEEVIASAITKKSNGEIQTALQSDSAGIGYVSLGYIEGVKPLSIDGTECSIATCQSGKYPISRRLYFNTKSAPDEPVKAFIDFCRSTEGQKIAAELGYIPLVI